MPPPRLAESSPTSPWLGSCAHGSRVLSVPPQPTPYGPGDELLGAGQGRGSRRSSILPNLGEVSVGEIRALPPPWIPGDPPPTLLLVGGPGITGPSRGPQSRGHFGSTGITHGSRGRQSPEATLKGATQGQRHRAPLGMSPSPRLPLAPAVLRATCTAGMSSPLRGREAATSSHPITGMSAGTRPTAQPRPPALPASPPAAGTSRLLFLALQRCALPAMAPYITIIAGCQRLEAGSQDRGGASTPLVTCHSVPAELWSSTGYFRKSNLLGRRSTSHTFSS